MSYEDAVRLAQAVVMQRNIERGMEALLKREDADPPGPVKESMRVLAENWRDHERTIREVLDD